MTVVFSKDTTGYGTGKEIELESYDGIEEGPIQGLGVRHFFDREEIEECLTDVGFRNILIEKTCIPIIPTRLVSGFVLVKR